MNIAGIIFLGTGGIVIFKHLQKQYKFFIAINSLESQLKQEGIDWSYRRDMSTQIKLHDSPESIFLPSDSEQVRKMKQVVIDRRQEIFRSYPKHIKVMFIGMGVAIIVSIIESVVYPH